MNGQLPPCAAPNQSSAIADESVCKNCGASDPLDEEGFCGYCTLVVCKCGKRACECGINTTLSATAVVATRLRTLSGSSVWYDHAPAERNRLPTLKTAVHLHDYGTRPTATAADDLIGKSVFVPHRQVVDDDRNWKPKRKRVRGLAKEQDRIARNQPLLRNHLLPEKGQRGVDPVVIGGLTTKEWRDLKDDWEARLTAEGLPEALSRERRLSFSRDDQHIADRTLSEIGRVGGARGPDKSAWRSDDEIEDSSPNGASRNAPAFRTLDRKVPPRKSLTLKKESSPDWDRGQATRRKQLRAGSKTTRLCERQPVPDAHDDSPCPTDAERRGPYPPVDHRRCHPATEKRCGGVLYQWRDRGTVYLTCERCLATLVKKVFKKRGVELVGKRAVYLVQSVVMSRPIRLCLNRHF